MNMRNINSNVFRPGKTHTLSATTSSGATRTSAFTTQINEVMVTATAACFIEFGGDPTAATSTTYIAAATPYFFRVSEANKCAAITGTGTSSVYITELTR
tara:strand:- start:193 stop:492 length:300 start_codon:yes stop_codon:yes gene_type:complete